MGEFEADIKRITGLEEKDFIKLFKNRDTEFVSAMKHIEEHGLRCLNMLNGQESWNKDLANKRKEQERPMLSENLLPDFVNKPHGEFCMSSPSATVLPVDSEGDPKVADVMKGLIYHTSYQSQGASIHNDAFYSLLACGLAAWRVLTRRCNNKTFNVEHYLKYISNPFSISWDLSAEKVDLSDKKWVLIKDTMLKSEFKKQYGEDAWKPVEWEKSIGSRNDKWFVEEKATVAEVWWIQEDEFTLYEHPDGTASREKPGVDVDEDENGKKLRTAQAFDRKVWSCVMSGTDILTEPVDWPDYTDEPIIPVIIAHGRKLIVAGKIYYKAIISDGLDLQQLHNYWITAITESIALQPDAPYLATDAQVFGYEEWKDLSIKTRVMRYKHDPKAGSPMPKREMPPQLSAAVLNMPQYTRQALRDVIGLQQASLGIQSNEKSGIAISKRKQEGDAGKYAFVENMTRAIELEARIQVNTLPSIMDTPRIERILGPDGSKSIAYIKQVDPRRPDEAPIDLEVGKYDAVVTIGNTFATQRDEAKEILVQLFQYLGPIAPQAVAAIAPKLLKIINVPDADEIARIIVATLPPQLQAFYQTEDKAEMKIPPEVLAQVQALQQRFVELQQLAQQQNQMIESLKKDEAVKLRELEGRQGLEQEKLKVEREKIMKEITLKEKDIDARRELELEKINANIELELAKLMETFKAQRELEEFKSEIATKQAEVKNEKKPEAASPATEASA